MQRPRYRRPLAPRRYPVRNTRRRTRCASPTTASVHPPETMQKNRPTNNERMMKEGLGQSLGCRREVGRSIALTADDLMAAPANRQVPGCRASEPTGGRPAASQLAALRHRGRVGCRQTNEKRRRRRQMSRDKGCPCEAASPLRNRIYQPTKQPWTIV